MRAPAQRVEQQLLQLRRNQHHVRAQRIHQFARRVRFKLRLGGLRRRDRPAHRIFFVHARQFDHAAVFAQRLRQPLKAILVVHLHAPRVGGNAQKIGDKNQQRLRIGRLEIPVQRGKLILLRAPRVELPHIAHKNHLKRRHQRRRLRAIQHIKNRG